MTRLVKDDIKHISRDIKSYDELYFRQTGKTMAQTACYAYGIKDGIANKKVAVIPVTSGLGTIECFSESVCAILKHIGADVFVTSKTDVAGLQEAYLKGSDMVFMADDDVCAAFSLRSGAVSDNGEATGIAFAAALGLAMGSSEEKVLVLGCGPVGSAAASYLSKKGKKVDLYDVIPGKADKFRKTQNISVLDEKPDLKDYSYVVDATPDGGWISEDMVRESAVYSAPGMPLSLTDEALKKVTLIHNPLELGIIAMYYDCAFKAQS